MRKKRLVWLTCSRKQCLQSGHSVTGETAGLCPWGRKLKALCWALMDFPGHPSLLLVWRSRRGIFHLRVSPMMPSSLLSFHFEEESAHLWPFSLLWFCEVEEANSLVSEHARSPALSFREFAGTTKHNT